MFLRGIVDFTLSTSRPVFATRRVPHVEQGMSSRPEHLSSLPVFSGVRVGRFLVFCVMFCKLLFILFHLATVLSVL
jgi:hypothetical protein